MGNLRLTRRGRLVRSILLALVLVLFARCGVSALTGSDTPKAVPTPTASPSPSAAALPTLGPPITGFDLVIRNGRVMDPETKLDAIRNVGVKGGTITEISDRLLEGKRVIDARGKVVAPGFIDLLSYEPTNFGIWYKVADGITTLLGMHGFNSRASSFFPQANRTGWPVNYGGAFDEPHFRATLGIGAFQKPTASQVRRLAALAERELNDGYIGIDFEPEYSPGTTADEMIAVSKVAAKHKAAAYFHVRYSDDEEPGTEQDSIAEVLRIARAAKVAVHVEHINSTGATFEPAKTFKMLSDARAAGIDATACIYPYDFWSTFLGSARFAPGWQDRFNISYNDLAIPGTGERLTESSFDRYRRENRVVIAYAIPPASVVAALKQPFVMLGSDSILVANEGRHPRASGTMARTLGYYVREKKTLSLMDALAKMTLLPAERLQGAAPAMKKKGRLQIGMDADITIFDPRTVIDRATVEEPAQYSKGIYWVINGGVITKDPNGVRKSERPGVPILSAAAIQRRVAWAKT